MTDIVPPDMWICSACNGPNLIELAEERCPVCEHVRCPACKGPGDEYTVACGLFLDPDMFSLSTGSFPATAFSIPGGASRSLSSIYGHGAEGFTKANVIGHLGGDGWDRTPKAGDYGATCRVIHSYC
ncbi:hypothetical protein K432DRAFT_472008 [Lepidopterella palustris CBS 459.81]|uniref:Uncharacterized protein n=1 Tax=Lepidopterella palustris CBS 459.81 TaxID=1314670 RepID=A0A8E2JHB6_9PEZI|nr:hypothetical protein K432DRAFT_472008 [Lepidopterella palustris CBS 459.81]